MYYVVMEIGWEYDDSYYHNSGEGSGSPVKIFTNPEQAEALALAENIKALRILELGAYLGEEGISSWTSSNPEALEELLQSMDIDTEDYWRIQIPKTATDEQVKQVLDLLNIRWYEVVQVEE